METKNSNTPAITEQPDQPKLTQAEIISAATNSSALNQDVFTFGGREFTLRHLDYDSYLEFMAFLQPLLQGIAGQFAKARGVSLPGGIDMPNLTPEAATSALMTFCKKDLPSMACIVCNQAAIQDEKPELMVDTKWLKKHAQDPFEIIGIILKQVNKNQMISRFTDFFVQILPLVSAVTGMNPTIPATESTTGTTPS